MDYATPANYIRYWRKFRKLSQTALAERIGVDESTVSKWETGAQSPMGKLDQIAAALDLHPGQIIFGPDAKPGAANPPLIGLADDAAPFTGGLPGLHLDLADTETPYQITGDSVSRASPGRRLVAGDIAIFDIGATMMQAFHGGQIPDGSVVIAQAVDEVTGDAATIVRQWLGDAPGLLIANGGGANRVINLLQHGEISIMGVLTRSIRHHGPSTGRW